jgi:hypothetical protein
MSYFFTGRSVVIATKHGKEKVIAPILQAGLAVGACSVAPIDTDELGTFSGEIERKGAPIDVLRKKCELAYQETSCSLVVASEGSFGPHPSLFFIPAGDEWLLLKDFDTEIEIVVRELSVSTNFSGGSFETLQDVLVFAERCLFPTHGIVIRAGEKDFRGLQKGVLQKEQLIEAVDYCLANYNQVYVETDMRAHLNPTRMEVIKRATEKLVQKANSLCPSCQYPGFDAVSLKEGLPCMLCGTPTSSILYIVKGCTSCGFFQYGYHPKDKKVEDPQYCPRCNP